MSREGWDNLSEERSFDALDFNSYTLDLVNKRAAATVETAEQLIAEVEAAMTSMAALRSAARRRRQSAEPVVQLDDSSEAA